MPGYVCRSGRGASPVGCARPVTCASLISRAGPARCAGPVLYADPVMDASQVADLSSRRRLRLTGTLLPLNIAPGTYCPTSDHLHY